MMLQVEKGMVVVEEAIIMELLIMEEVIMVAMEVVTLLPHNCTIIAIISTP